MALGRDDLDILRAALRNAGLRATRSRIAVLHALRSAGSPASHGEVVARLASQAWDPATIYRNLTDLSDVGLARRLDVGDHVWRFEAITGGRQRSAHAHFVCTECGSVECLPDLEYVITRSRAPRAVRLKRVEIHLRGACDACM